MTSVRLSDALLRPEWVIDWGIESPEEMEYLERNREHFLALFSPGNCVPRERADNCITAVCNLDPKDLERIYQNDIKIEDTILEDSE